MKIINLLLITIILPLVLGFIPARIVYLRLNKKTSKYKWLFSVLTFVFIFVLISAVIIAIIIAGSGIGSSSFH